MRNYWDVRLKLIITSMRASKQPTIWNNLVFSVTFLDMKTPSDWYFTHIHTFSLLHTLTITEVLDNNFKIPYSACLLKPIFSFQSFLSESASKIDKIRSASSPLFGICHLINLVGSPDSISNPLQSDCLMHWTHFHISCCFQCNETLVTL